MKNHLRSILFIGAIILFATTCKDPEPEPEPQPTLPTGTSFIEPSEQRQGDADRGYQYLIAGDYVDSGVPYDLYITAGADNNNYLGREGDNASVAHDFTAVNAANGVRVVSANCFQCHAQFLNGELVVGLGNSMADFTEDQSGTVGVIDFAINLAYGNGSPEWVAYEPFRTAVLATGSELVTSVRGVNPADKLAAILSAHRDQVDLTWLDNRNFEIPEGVVPTDVPAWWLLKKKNAMFYAGIGRGDFARIMMASSILTLQDSTKAREVDNEFADVLAFINNLEAPAYPNAIDEAKVARGETIFKDNCAQCHGTYGVEDTYPNLLVELDVIGTDPTVASANYAYPEFVEWYNNSWFGDKASIQATEGYVAPPLDGIWATAPYLHNGSVPDLHSLLKSSDRPDYWIRSFNSNDLNYEKMGWNYIEETGPGGSETYNTTLTGYGNQGHTFGDFLNEDERADLIEYLKTL